MEQSDYKKVLEEYLNTWESLPKVNRHMPDELDAKIASAEDFFEFLRFVVANLDHEKYFEFGCEDTELFLQRVAEYQSDKEVINYAKSKGIESEFGFLAYIVTLALGN